MYIPYILPLACTAQRAARAAPRAAPRTACTRCACALSCGQRTARVRSAAVGSSL